MQWPSTSRPGGSGARVFRARFVMGRLAQRARRHLLRAGGTVPSRRRRSPGEAQCATIGSADFGPVANSGVDHMTGETALFSGGMSLRGTKTEREQPVLLAHRPGASEAKALA